MVNLSTCVSIGIDTHTQHNTLLVINAKEKNDGYFHVSTTYNSRHHHFLYDDLQNLPCRSIFFLKMIEPRTCFFFLSLPFLFMVLIEILVSMDAKIPSDFNVKQILQKYWYSNKILFSNVNVVCQHF